VERPYRLLSAARAMERCGLPDEAQTVLAQAADADPRNAAVRLRQARLFARRREWPAAMTALDTGERLFRDRNNFEGVSEVLVARGTYQEQQEALDLAAATLSKAREIADSNEDVRQRIRARFQLAIVNRKRGDVRTAERLIAEATDLARRQNLETLTLEGLIALGNVYVVRNFYREAESTFELVRTIAETHRNEEQRARAWLALGTVYVRVMEPDKAEKAVLAALPYFERTKQARNLLIADMLVAQIQNERAEYSVAANSLEKAIARAREHKDPDLEGTARQYLATALTGMGRYSDALVEYNRLLEGRRGAGRVGSETVALLNVADTQSMMGLLPEAAATLRQAEALLRTIVPLPAEIESQMLVVRAAHALREGRSNAAWADARKARDVGAGLSTARETTAYLLSCSAGVLLGRVAEAQSSCETARRTSRLETLASLWIETQLVNAEVTIRLGHFDGVEALLSEARRVVDKSQPSGDKWRVLCLAAALPAAGRTERQESLTRELRRLRMLWGEPAFQDWWRRPDVRSLLTLAGMPKGDSYVLP
jgi:tetratricopeptide (TPR) repeat protein